MSSSDHQVAIIEAAVAYTRRGWWVFPAPPNGKKQGLRSATDKGERWGSVYAAAEVREVFGAQYLQKRFGLRRCNVGVCTGIESGLVVIDVDTAAAHGKDGVASLRALEKKYGKLPRTLTAITPSGGMQYFFRHPGDDVYIPCSASKLGEGIDVKADGGMVVAPPSSRKGAAYRWDRRRGDNVAAMPDWLITLVTRDVRKRRGPKNFFEQFADNELRRPASVAELTIALALIPNNDLDWES
jgi:Bifunctional DNA primase/polymerase, N-terminal